MGLEKHPKNDVTRLNHQPIRQKSRKTHQDLKWYGTIKSMCTNTSFFFLNFFFLCEFSTAPKTLKVDEVSQAQM